MKLNRFGLPPLGFLKEGGRGTLALAAVQAAVQAALLALSFAALPTGVLPLSPSELSSGFQPAPGTWVHPSSRAAPETPARPNTPGTANTPAIHDTIREGRTARPDYLDWEILSLDGVPTTLESFRGKVLFLHMWATWCPPCVEELAEIEALRESLSRTEGIAFLLVSPERPKDIRRFLRLHDFDLPFFVEGQDLPSAFGLEALPSTFVLNPMGSIVLRHRGAGRWDSDPVREFLLGLAGVSHRVLTPVQGSPRPKAHPVPKLTPSSSFPEGSDAGP